MTTYTDIFATVHTICGELPREKLKVHAYIVRWLDCVAAAGRITRLDLFHLLEALAEGHFSYVPKTDAERELIAVWSKCDEAAAFGSRVSPLVWPRDRLPGPFDYSVFESDTAEVAEHKRDHQRPSTPWERFERRVAG